MALKIENFTDDHLEWKPLGWLPAERLPLTALAEAQTKTVREASAALPPRAVTFSDVGVVLSSLVDAQAGRFGRARTTQTVGRPGRTNNRHQRFAFAAGNCFLANNNPQSTPPLWAGRASRTLGPWRAWLLLTADQHKA